MASNVYTQKPRTIEELQFDVEFTGNIYRTSAQMFGERDTATRIHKRIWEENKAELAQRLGPIIVFDTDTMMLEAA